jgi:hypothetical protein
MKHAKKLVALAVLGLGGAAAAHAGTYTFTFQPCGNNTCAIAADTLDWSPGNVLSQGGAGGGAVLPPGTKVNDLYQANLGVVKNAGATVFSQGSGGNYFSAVAGFGELVTGAAAFPGGATNYFGLDAASSTNFFKVYALSADGNDLTGKGFTTGNVILSGKAVDVFSQVTALFANPPGFDNFGPDDYPGVTTIRSSGSTDITMEVLFADSNYFPDLPVGTTAVFGLNTGNLISPFSQANPSATFSSDGVADGDVPHNIGAINGIVGPDFQFQADVSSSFVVPEPGTLALFGASLLGVFGGAVRRKTSA